NIPFMSYRKMAYIVSIAGIVIGMGVFAARGSGNFGVDFTTGTNLIVQINSDIDVNPQDIENALEGVGFPDVQAQRYESDGVTNGYNIHFGIRPEGVDTLTAPDGEGTDTGSNAEQLAIAKLVNPDATPANMGEYVEIESENTVGPAVGDALK